MSDANSPVTSSYITTTESTLGGEIKRMLESDEMLIGDGPSYELAKSCFLYHPLGRKMAEGPVALAQSQKRRITIGDAPPVTWGRGAMGQYRLAATLRREECEK